MEKASNSIIFGEETINLQKTMKQKEEEIENQQKQLHQINIALKQNNLSIMTLETTVSQQNTNIRLLKQKNEITSTNCDHISMRIYNQETEIQSLKSELIQKMEELNQEKEKYQQIQDSITNSQNIIQDSQTNIANIDIKLPQMISEKNKLELENALLEDYVGSHCVDNQCNIVQDQIAKYTEKAQHIKDILSRKAEIINSYAEEEKSKKFQLDEIKEQNHKLKKEIVSIKQKINKINLSESTKYEYIKRISYIDQTIFTYSKKKMRLNRRINSLKKKISTNPNNNKKLRDLNKKVKKWNHERELDNEELVKQTKLYNAIVNEPISIDYMPETVQKQNLQLLEMISENKKLKNKRKNLKNDFHSLRKAAMTLQIDIEDAETILKQIKIECSVYQTKIQNMQNTYNSLSNQINEMNKATEVIQQNISEISNNENSVAILQQENYDLKKRVARLENEYSDFIPSSKVSAPRKLHKKAKKKVNS